VRSWYVVRLCHPEPAKAIELARAKDPALIEQYARDSAQRLGLPLSLQHYEPTAAATRRAKLNRPSYRAMESCIDAEPFRHQRVRT
jgi:hypothetical protein